MSISSVHRRAKRRSQRLAESIELTSKQEMLDVLEVPVCCVDFLVAHCDWEDPDDFGPHLALIMWFIPRIASSERAKVGQIGAKGIAKALDLVRKTWPDFVLDGTGPNLGARLQMTFYAAQTRWLLGLENA